MKYIKICFLLFFLIIYLPAQESTAVQNSVSSGVLGNGGAVLGNSSYRIVGTLGQPIIGTVQNPANQYNFGFCGNVRDPKASP